MTFDPDGGTLTGETSRQTDENGKLTLPAAEDCTKDGCTLVGWTKEDKSYEPDSEVTFEEDTALTAQWEKTYTVTFNGNGGTRKEGEADVGTAEQSILESAFTEAGDKGVALDPNTFEYTDTDYVFTGWSKNNDNTPTIENGGTVKKDEFTDAQLTLYACWAEKVTVTFDPNYNTSIKHKTQDVPKDVETPLDKNTYIRSGYLFVGWYDNEECTGTARESIKTSSDVTLYARWAGPVKMTGSVSGAGANAYVGETLTATVDNAEEITDFTYQWYWYGKTTAGTGWHAISGAKKETYIPTSDNNGKRITCRVAKGDAWVRTNYKLVAGELSTVKLKQDIIDVVDGKAASEYAQPGQIQGVTKDMEYSMDGGKTWSKLTDKSDKNIFDVSDDGVMSVLEPGDYTFRIAGTEIKTADPIKVSRWFTLSYSASNTLTSSSTAYGRTTTSIGGNGTAKMLTDGKAMPVQTTETSANPNIKRYAGETNTWLVREGAEEAITLVIRPSTRSYGHWNVNQGSYHNVGSETTIAVSPMKGPEHYKIIFNRTSSSPRTADESNLGLWTALCVTSLTGAAMILTQTRRRRKNEQE